MQYTDEQLEIVDAVLQHRGEEIIAINAVSGSGKTETADAIIRAYNPCLGFYTAFNKAIVQDSAKRFGDLIEARTIHSLAYRFIKPSTAIEELNYSTITENISYKEKADVLKGVDDFFKSKYVNVEDYVLKRIDNTEIQYLVVKYAMYMLQDKVAPTFNYMLKCFHIMLAHGEVAPEFDLFIFDECADMIPVTLEIFKLLKARTKVILGDKYQNIYSFMNTVNAFDKLDGLLSFRLTQSFRCNPEVAEQIEVFGKNYLDPNFRFKGNPNIQKQITREDAYISRTNATLIRRIETLLEQGQTFSLIRPPSEIFKFPLAVYTAAQGGKVKDKQYKYLEKEYKEYQKIWGYTPKPYSYYDHLKNTIDDPIVNSTINLLEDLRDRGTSILNLTKSVTKVVNNPSIVLTTAHAFKGLEADYIYIEDDLNDQLEKAHTLKEVFEEKNRPIPQHVKEEFNIYYVALSRARFGITNNKY